MKQQESPFPGPIPIKRERDAEGQDVRNLFGRDSDVDQICKLLIAERIVLLYSPSGAGKTSLIQAGLLPRIEKEDFTHFPIFRPDKMMPDSAVARTEFVQNLFVTLNLDPALSYEKGGFRNAVQANCQKVERDVVLVLDGFERMLTTHPRFQDAVDYFFQEVGAALTDKKLGLWALISIREDLIALLDPYLHYFPNALRARYRLNYLTPDGAQIAVEEPAKKGGAPFSPGAAVAFVNNLRAIERQNGKSGKELDRYVDPFQLQVACLDLWKKLPDSTEEIQKRQIPSPATITDALANYISSQVEPAAKLARVEENVVRDWLERSLIDSRGFRIQTASGPANEAAENEILLKSLEAGYLIQSVHRGERTWYELTHDRLSEAVRASNRVWRASHLDWFAERALEYEVGKSNHLLLRGKEFKEVERQIKQKQRQLTQAEDLFWRACVNDHRSLQLKASIRNLIIFACLLVVGLIYLLLLRKKGDDHVESRNLAVAASSIMEIDPEASILLGLDAAEKDRRRVWGVYPLFHADPIESETKDLLNRALQESRLTLRIPPSAISDRPTSSDVPTVRELHAVAFAPKDSKELIVADLDGDLAVLNGITGEVLNQRHDLERKARTSLIGPAMVFSGNLIAAAGDSSKHITIINRRTATMWQCQLKREGEVYGLAFDPSGGKIAAATSSGIALWDIIPQSILKGSSTAGSCKDTTLADTRLDRYSRVTAVSFLNDGRLVSVHSDIRGNVYLWDHDLSHEPQRLAQLAPASLDSSFVKSIAVGGPDAGDDWIGFATSRGAVILDRKSNQLVAFSKAQQHPVNAIAFSRDGHLFATGSDEGSINVWTATQLGLSNVEPTRGGTTVGKDQPPRTVASTPILSKSSTSGPIQSLSFSADSQLLAAAGGDVAVRVWDVAALRSEPVGARFKLSPDGKSLATIRYANGLANVVIRDIVSDLESIPLPCSYCWDVAFSPNGAQFAVSGGGLKDTSDPLAITHGVQVYGMQGLSKISSFQEWYAYQSALSADGNVLATLGVEGIHVWNTVQGSALANEGYKYEPAESDSRMNGADTRSWSPVSAIALAANAAYLAAGSQDGTVTVWNFPISTSALNDRSSATHRPDPRRITLGRVKGDFAISSLLFGDVITDGTNHKPDPAANANFLAVADVGGNVTIWDVGSGRKLWEMHVTFPSNRGATRIHGMAFSRRLDRFAVAADDGVKVWRLKSHPIRELLYEKPVYALAFAQEKGADKLVGVDGNGRVLNLIVDDQALEEKAQQRVTKGVEGTQCLVYLGEPCSRDLNDLDDFVEGRALARAGNEKEAEKLLSRAARNGFSNSKTANQTYKEFRAAALTESARDEQGDLTLKDRADHMEHVTLSIQEYKQAFELDPTLGEAAALADIAESLASLGKIDEAVAAYHDADELDHSFFNTRANSRFPNNICWSAAMADVDPVELKKVLPICEQAVKVEENAPPARDSRGIVRALTEDIRGAMDDETAFRDWTGKPWDRDRRADWIKCIRASSPAGVCNSILVTALRNRYGAPVSTSDKK